MKRLMYELFAVPPDVWGLRGDPYLWEAMRTHFYEKKTELPFESEKHFRALIANAFEDLTAKPIDAREAFYDQRFAHGGMSSGHIDPVFWREDGMQYLVRAYLRAGSADQC